MGDRPPPCIRPGMRTCGAFLLHFCIHKTVKLSYSSLWMW